MTERRVALATLAVGLLALVVGGVLHVPWDPVPGGRLTPVPVAQVLTPEEVDRAEAFARWSRLWSWSSLGASILVACWFGLTDRGRRLVSALPGRWWVRVPLAVSALILVGRLVTFPCAVALRRLRLDEGLTHQSWAAFGLDVARTEAVSIVSTSVVVLVLVGCARRWKRAWPAIAGGVLAVLVVAGSFAYPVIVEPLFTDVEPLPDGSLRTRILALAEAEGVEVDDVLVADASQRTTTLNAYVSGFGATRRVVVYDTLRAEAGRPAARRDDGTLATSGEDEVLAVVAHELAHARHHDVVTGTVLGAAGVLAGVGLLGLVLAAARRRGAPEPGDPQAVPLVLALAALAMFAVAPVTNAVSRQLETRADVDAVRASSAVDGGAQAQAAFIGVQRRLAQRSLADPTPPALAQLWFASHPGVLTRIAIAQRVAD